VLRALPQRVGQVPQLAPPTLRPGRERREVRLYAPQALERGFTFGTALVNALAANAWRTPASTSSRAARNGTWRAASVAHSSQSACPGRPKVAIIWSIMPQRTPT